MSGDTDSLYYFILFFSLFHILLNSFSLIVFLGFEFYRLFNYTFVKKLHSHQEKLLIICEILGDNDIFPIFWNLLIGILALISYKEYWIYTIQLFSVYFIFPTMFSVILSVKERYEQFLATGLLIVIVILAYSSISFIFFNELYYSSELGVNFCSSYLYCFLNMLNNGIRTEGLGDFSTIKSFKDVFYISHFIFGWIFFFTVIQILLNIINGIIVDTFQEIREKNNKKEYDRSNVCYICHLDRSTFEVGGVSFSVHGAHDHSLLNYLHYIIGLFLENENNLNAIDYST